MHYDLIVIGMGLSGLMAAKTAVEAGQKVLIVGKGMGGLTLFSNTIDLLGLIPETMKMREGLSEWIQDHPDHPYGKVGVEKIEEALSSFSSLFPPPYTFQSKNGLNSLVPTGAGTFRPTYLIPSTMMKGISLKGEKALIVGFDGYMDFYPQRLAQSFQCRGINLSLPEKYPREVSATTLARWMEQPSFREFIAEGIKGQWKGESLVGFPAVLGIQDPMKVRRDLEKRLGVFIFEIPVLPPSVPGLRIFRRFKEWLIQKGAAFLQGYSVSNVLLRGRRCEAIEITHPPIKSTYTAKHYILATGRFMAGGLRADREKIWEDLFHLPIFSPCSKTQWFGASFFEDHPIHQVGILTDSSFRPLDEEGRIVLENVRITGTILAGHRALSEKSREGIEIVTGYWATKNIMKD